MVYLFENEFRTFENKAFRIVFWYSIVTGSRYAECHRYPTAGYIVAAAGVTEFPEICAVATQRKPGYEFHISSND
jgi:hypothetical protein